ncbi:MAG: T9SS type A sorting domain-containing protein [Candidatus Marinimicrobia bacterium]|nr:T9SS type A sorting domain-containing protein [Candidatus Neomarinimicrobiota bacterium]
MNRKSIVLIIIAFILSLTFLSARSYRVSMVPYGTNWSCNTCHTDGGGTPRNPFGQSVESITGSSEASFWGAPLAVLDSDGDGFMNGEELQDSAGIWTSGSANPGTASLVTHPGDAADYPATTAINDGTPFMYELGYNYPNPFNPGTLISYALPVNAHVVIDIYNVLGEKVRTLVNESSTQGVYVTIWNGQDDLGNQVNSGIYFYRMTAGNYSNVKRMVLMK